MIIESWMLSGLVTVIIVAGNLFITRNTVQDLKKHQGTVFNRLDAHGDDIVALKTRSELAMTAKDVDDKYVSKELFRQFEKHIDKRFDALEAGQAEILDFIRNQKRGCND